MSPYEDKYQQLLTTIPVGLGCIQLVRDEANRPQDCLLLEANAALAAMTGRPREAIINQKFTDVWPDINLDEKAWREIWEESFRGVKSFQFQCGSRTGLRWYQVQVSGDEPRQPDRFVAVFLEITDQKQELNSALSLYQALVDNIPGLTFRCQLDQDWTMLYMSDAVDPLTGYPSSDFVQNAVRTYESVIHPDDTDFVARSINAAVAAGRPWNIEYRVCHKDGSIRWAHEIGRGVPGEDGQVAFLDGLVLDITGQKQALLQLAESEEVLRQISESVGEVFWLRDADDSTMLYVNPAYETVWGRSCQSLYDDPQSFMESVYEEDRPAVWAEFERYLHKLEFNLEYRIVRGDGEIRWVHARSFPVQDSRGVVVRHTGVAVDITGRKLLEEEVRFRSQFQVLLAEISATFIKTTLEGMDQAVDSMLQRCGQFFQADRAFLLRLSPDARRVTRVHEWCSTGVPGVRQERQDCPLDDWPLMEKLVQGQKQLLIPDASVLPETAETEREELQGNQVLSALYLPLARQDAVLGFLGLEAVKARRDFEAGQAEMLRILGNTVADALAKSQLEKEMWEARERADRASAAKSQFIANMSHELRTPLNAVMGFAELAQKCATEPQLRDYLDKIQGAAGTLLDTIGDILDYSEIEKGKMGLEKREFSLSDLTENVLQQQRPRARGKGVRINGHLDNDVPSRVAGDPVRLGKVLGHLLDNAVKFTEQGEVTMRLSRAGMGPTGARILFSLRDTGIGIATEEQTRLFQPFVQADSSSTRQYGGTGLGLVISQSLVGMMGGRIEVESQPGAGSHFFFTVEFPQVSSVSPEKTAALSHDSGGARVLIVCDSHVSCGMLQFMLEGARLWVECAPSVTAARGILHEAGQAPPPGPEPSRTRRGHSQCGRPRGTGPLALVLVDWKVCHGKDIENLGADLKECGGSRAPGLVLLVSPGNEGLETRARKAGVNACLVKPVSQSALLETVYRLLGTESGGSYGAEPGLSAEDDGVASLLGARILVVDDSPLNQQVARDLLEGAGASVDTARNGWEAVQRIQTRDPGNPVSDYDAVLMDLQMPEMDGFETTRRIRTRKTRDDLPVIALTAHAMEEEWEKSLAVGMNDYLTKPVDSQQLFQVLSRWITAPTGCTTTNEAPEVSGVRSPVSIPSLPGLDTDAAIIRLGGNAELYRRVLDRFVKEQEKTADHLEEFLAQGQCEAAARLVHTLKGAAGSIGAFALQEQARGLEEALRAGKVEPGSWQPVQESLKAVMSVLRNASWQGGSETAQAQELSEPDAEGVSPEVNEIIQQLDQLLQAGSFEALETFDGLSAALASAGLDDELGAVQACLQSFSLDDARVELDRLARKLGSGQKGNGHGE